MNSDMNSGSDGGSLEVGGRFVWAIEARRIGLCYVPRIRAMGEFHNGLATEGINAMLDAYFRGGTAPAGLYVGIIDNDDYTALSSGDIMASHAGWIENTDYSQLTRPEWSPGAAASGFLAASSACLFTMTATTTAKGLFVCTDSTKDGTSGVLWAHGLFGTEQVLQVGETLKCYYELEARSG